MQYRQGDVLIESVLEIPAATRAVPRENGAIVLAHGEATGHAHRIANRVARFLETGDGARYLDLPTRARVVHPEHGAVTLPPGSYRVSRQVEYTPQEVRNVAD